MVQQVRRRGDQLQLRHVDRRRRSDCQDLDSGFLGKTRFGNCRQAARTCRGVRDDDSHVLDVGAISLVETNLKKKQCKTG